MDLRNGARDEKRSLTVADKLVGEEHSVSVSNPGERAPGQGFGFVQPGLIPCLELVAVGLVSASKNFTIRESNKGLFILGPGPNPKPAQFISTWAFTWAFTWATSLELGP